MSDNEIRNLDNVWGKIAKISFAIFTFFIFFGTAIPFKERSHAIEDTVTSNIVNQVVFGSLFIVSIMTLLFKKNEVIKVIKKEKFFFIFILWCLTTVIWSDYSGISLKRFVLFLSTITIPLSMLIYSKNSDESIKFFYYILGFYVIVSIVSVIAIPMARHGAGSNWRGIASHKNGLGQIVLLAIITFGIFIFKTNTAYKRAFALFLLAIALLLLVGTRSSTSLFTFIIIMCISITFYIDKFFKPIGIKRTFSITIMFFAIILLVIFSMFATEVFEPFLASQGKDLTFSGRIGLWQDIWNEAQNNLIIGAGFRSFWIVTSPRLQELYEVYLNLPIQAHNGYLDIINELGIIGITLFLLLLVNYFVNLKKSKHVQVWKWFVIALVIINFTESTIITPRGVTGVMFIFSYFALFTDLHKSENFEHLKG